MPEYLLNCFWLLVPVLVFNLLFARRLPPAFHPEAFARAVPRASALTEHALRALVMLLPLLMPMRSATPSARLGWVLYLAGVVVYFASWGVLILAPHCGWSRSAPGLMAPAYTPALWLLGIGLIGTPFAFRSPFVGPWLYWTASSLFLLLHNLHAHRAYVRAA